MNEERQMIQRPASASAVRRPKREYESYGQQKRPQSAASIRRPPQAELNSSSTKNLYNQTFDYKKFSDPSSKAIRNEFKQTLDKE
jgi:hypothetical protein